MCVLFSTYTHTWERFVSRPKPLRGEIEWIERWVQIDRQTYHLVLVWLIELIDFILLTWISVRLQTKYYMTKTPKKLLKILEKKYNDTLEIGQVSEHNVWHISNTSLFIYANKVIVHDMMWTVQHLPKMLCDSVDVSASVLSARIMIWNKSWIFNKIIPNLSEKYLNTQR